MCVVYSEPLNQILSRIFRNKKTKLSLWLLYKNGLFVCILTENVCREYLNEGQTENVSRPTYIYLLTFVVRVTVTTLHSSDLFPHRRTQQFV